MYNMDLNSVLGMEIYQAFCLDVAQGQYERGTQWDSNSLV